MTLLPTLVSFRHLGHSDALEEDIRERAAVLEQYYAGIGGVEEAGVKGPQASTVRVLGNHHEAAPRGRPR